LHLTYAVKNMIIKLAMTFEDFSNIIYFTLHKNECFKALIFSLLSLHRIHHAKFNFAFSLTYTLLLFSRLFLSTSVKSEMRLEGKHLLYMMCMCVFEGKDMFYIHNLYHQHHFRSLFIQLHACVKITKTY
jgi:hypothetical protein